MNTTRPTCSRRGFLARAGAGLLVLSAGIVTGCKVLFSPDAGAMAAELVALLRRQDLARDLGQAYVEANLSPGSRFVDSLTLALLDSIGIHLDEVALLPLATLVTALVGKVRDDFARENTVAVRGWLLSVTEARVCGILYLRDRPDREQ